MSKKRKMFSKSWMILLSLLTCFSFAIINEIETANVMVSQRITVINKDGAVFDVLVPTGSVVFSPEYFDKLSTSLQIKDKIIEDLDNSNDDIFNKKIYMDASYGTNSGADITIGGKLELVI